MHYRIRANVYMVLGRGVWLVAVLVSTFVRILGGGRGSHVGKSSAVALIFGFGMESCQTFVILIHCAKCGFLVCMIFNVLQYNIIFLAACFDSY